MRLLPLRPHAFAPLLGAAFLLTAASGIAVGCKGERLTVHAIEAEVEPSGAERLAESRSDEATRRAEYEARIKARENQPEPTLDPSEPREKFELIWRMGKAQLDSIYAERSEILTLLKRVKLEDAKDAKRVAALLTRLQEFGIGHESEYMEQAATDLCAVLTEVNGPASELIEAGRAELMKLEAEEKELDLKVDAGGTVYQKQWDKLEDARKRWSAPVKAGKQLLLGTKSILEEAYVLADLGPRRAQIILRDCLKPFIDKPLALQLAQEQLVKTQSRAKWYRDLR